jgi:RNA polymerase sigma factor (sigma-70 family)
MIDFNGVPDEDLYGMCIRGDEGAWQYMYNYILTICKWKKWNLADEPEETAGEIVLHLIDKAIRKIKDKNSFRNFVKTITVNKIKDGFKKVSMGSIDDPVKTRKGDDFVPEHPDPNPGHDTILMNIEIASVIDNAVGKLSADCRRVVTEYLKFKTGLYDDYKELSRVLKMPVPTISSKVRRCLDKLVQFKEIRELRCY